MEVEIIAALDILEKQQESYDSKNQKRKRNKEIKKNTTPLMLALMCNESYEMMKVLFLYGIYAPFSADDWDYFMSSHEHLLIQKNIESVVENLIRSGANVNSCNTHKQTPLMFALRCNCKESVIVKLITSGANVNSYDYMGNTPLVIAIEYYSNKEMIIKLLIKYGADIHNVNSRGSSILHLIAENPLLDSKLIYKLLYKHKLHVNEVNRYGLSPLKSAILSSNISAIKLLLSCGADLKSDFGVDLYTILLSKCACDEDIVNILVYFGINLFTFENYKLISVIDFIMPYYHWDVDEGSDDGAQKKECINVIIKNVILLFNKEVREFFTNTEDLKLFSDFIIQCKIEVEKMKAINLTAKLTFFDFCFLKKTTFDKPIKISDSDRLYTNKQIEKLFPNFYKIIVLKLNYNKEELLTSNLRKKFENVFVSATSSPEDSFVTLNYDCLENVCHNLNRRELYNLFLASV